MYSNNTENAFGCLVQKLRKSSSFNSDWARINFQAFVTFMQILLVRLSSACNVAVQCALFETKLFEVALTECNKIILGT